MAATPWYATREQVHRALDVAETARADWQIDRALAGAVESVHGLLHRVFYPQLETRYFDWPNRQYARAWRIWLEQDELIEVTSIVNGDSGVLGPTEYLLEPVNDGPPFTRLEINLASSAGFSPGASSHQRSIAVLGLYGGAPNTEAPAGATAEALDASETGVDVTDGSLIGVGDLVRVDTERMVVTGRTWLDTGQNLGAPGLTDLSNGVAVNVTDGTAFHAGEQLLVDAERMLIQDVAGNVLAVKRAYRGSVLAAHTAGADLFVDRSLTVERGALGTTAATHLTAAPVVRWVPPALVNNLALAETMVTFEQEKAAYARTVGSGETEREASGRGLAAIRDLAYTRHGRQARLSAI